MWVSTKKKFNGFVMYFRFLQKNEFFIISLTNLKQFFSTKIHESSFFSIVSNSSTNKNLEVSNKELINLLENISEEEMKNINFYFYDENLKIKTEISITLTEGFPPFKLKFELDLKDADDFYSNLTFPLLEIIQLVKRNQDELFNIIKKKDAEIAEYILEGGNITHKNIKTEVFDKDKFLMNTLQKDNDKYVKSTELYKIYSSLLVEPVNNSQPEQHEELNNKSNEVISEIQTITVQKKLADQSPLTSTTTAFEISDTSIKIKKRKMTHILKNL